MGRALGLGNKPLKQERCSASADCFRGLEWPTNREKNRNNQWHEGVWQHLFVFGVPGSSSFYASLRKSARIPTVAFYGGIEWPTARSVESRRPAMSLP